MVVSHSEAEAWSSIAVNSNELVSIIIVNYNGEAYLRGCLRSVFEQSYREYEVILVDNGSVDSSVALISSDFPQVRLLALQSNLGFSGGNNAGVREARGNLVVLLNNDTLVEQGWLQALVGAVSQPGVALASSLVRTDGVPKRYYEKNGSINFLCHNIMRVYEKEQNIFYATGASLIFRKDLLGIPFDDDYFAYVEDVHLGLRARFGGWEIVHASNSVVRHFGSATSRRERRSFGPYLQERNRILTMLLFFNASVLLRFIPYFAANVITKFVMAVVLRRFPVVAPLKAYWWLLTHPLAIWRKRRALKSQKKIPDSEILSWMTCKLTNGESLPGRVVNAVSRAYCGLVGLRTIEFIPRGDR
jgi:GT2 family glycosyltransferase